MEIDRIRHFFNPKIVAVIGATDKPNHVGSSLVKNITATGFGGKIIPVNPNRDSVLGIKTFPNVTAITEAVDLAVIATPSPTVPAIVEECGQKGVTNIVIISSGFKEIGPAGLALSQKIKEAVDKYHICLLGPNCLGFIRPAFGLNASFAGRMPRPGSIAFVSQSGALGSSFIDWSLEQGFGFSYFVSLGEMLGMGFADMMEFFSRDEETKSIFLYMESLTEAERFLKASAVAALKKPVIVLKSGITNQGSQAALSHTGSITGDDSVFSAAFASCGILRVESIRDLYNAAATISMQRLPAGNRLAIVTNAGGPGVLATDSLITQGGQLSHIDNSTTEKLCQLLPGACNKSNPVDLLGDADPARYRNAVSLCLNDPNTDAVLVLLAPQAMTDPEAIAADLVTLKNESDKPILASWMGEQNVRKGADILKKGNIPVYKIPDDAVQTFINMYRYKTNLDNLQPQEDSALPEFNPKIQESTDFINAVLHTGRTLLTQSEAFSILDNFDIKRAPLELSTSKEQACQMAEAMGFPVVLKISSPQVIHKSDVGGVRINLSTVHEVGDAYDSIIANVNAKIKDAQIEGIQVQKMIKSPYQLLIGGRKDPLFGPIVVFGLGGTAVELFKDISIGLTPLSQNQALKLMQKTKVFQLLQGFRGSQVMRIDDISLSLVKLSRLLESLPLIQEIDINPFMAGPLDAVAVDCRIILNPDK